MFEKRKQKKMEAELVTIVEEDFRWRSISRIRADYETRFQTGPLIMQQRKRLYRALDALEKEGVVVKKLSVDMTEVPLSEFADPESELQSEGRPFGLFYRSRIAHEILSEAFEEPAIAAE